MIRLSIQVRQVIARLTLPVLTAVAFGLILLGKADAVIAEQARESLGDSLTPLYAALATPIGRLQDALGTVGGAFVLAGDNARLRQENSELRKWQAIALALDAENKRLKAALHWVPEPAPSFITARAIADGGGLYVRSVLVAVGPRSGVKQGAIALDDDGLLGRVTDVGARSVRVLLVTDLNSRVPVTLEGSGGRAIMVGTNGPRPRLEYWTAGTRPQEGERVVTSAVAGAFPAGLPVGTVHYGEQQQPEVTLAAHIDRIDLVRLFDFNLGRQLAPEAAPAVVTGR